ncbi:hypothetical protein [Tabrizicola sp.]|uniref:hypothetical protein n=1 Tax=Tabrizicola sp. TaxID=2005166 RepID=UPI0035B4D430
MHNPPPPEGTRPVDGRAPAPRGRQTGMWLVLAVLAAIIIAILAFSFDRTEPDPAIIPAEPAAPATDGAATDGAAIDGAATDGAATDGAATDGTATDGAAPEGTGSTETTPPATTP